MHISLDVWNTLIIPNKKFSEHRNKLIAKKIGCTPDTVGAVYSAVKLRLDKDSELYGIGLSPDAVYKQFSVSLSRISNINFWEIERKLYRLQDEIQELFLKYPPTIPGMTQAEMTIAWANGHTFSIASNNNFITGDTMYKFLSKPFGPIISFYIFSSDIEYAKPDPKFWIEVKESLKFNNVELSKLTHIGDNKICDFTPIMTSIIIKGPEELANTIKELCK